MASFRIQKAGPVPGQASALARSHDRIADLFNQGLAVNSDTITAERLPDGRFRLKLAPDLLGQLKTPPRFNVPPMPVVVPTPQCDPGDPTSISLQATLSGHLASGSECDLPNTDYTVAAVTPTATSIPCSTTATTAEADIEYVCPSDCISPDGATWKFQAQVNLSWSGVPGEHWFASFDIHYGGDSYHCGFDWGPILGGDALFELDLGVDPNGVHNVSFDDPNHGTVHYDIVLHITL